MLRWHLEDPRSTSADKIYIIGGIVDRNRLKGASFAKAQAAGIATAKFPLEKFVLGKVCRVLALNHVFYILLKYAQSGGDWARAFADNIPTRKGYTEGGVETQDPENSATDHNWAGSTNRWLPMDVPGCRYAFQRHYRYGATLYMVGCLLA